MFTLYSLHFSHYADIFKHAAPHSIFRGGDPCLDDSPFDGIHTVVWVDLSWTRLCRLSSRTSGGVFGRGTVLRSGVRSETWSSQNLFKTRIWEHLFKFSRKPREDTALNPMENFSVATPPRGPEFEDQETSVYFDVHVLFKARALEVPRCAGSDTARARKTKRVNTNTQGRNVKESFCVSVSSVSPSLWLCVCLEGG